MSTLREAIETERPEYRSRRYPGDLGELAMSAPPERPVRRRWLPLCVAIAAGLLWAMTIIPTTPKETDQASRLPEQPAIAPTDTSANPPMPESKAPIKRRVEKRWPSVLSQLSRLNRRGLDPTIVANRPRQLTMKEINANRARRAKVLLASKAPPPPAATEPDPNVAASRQAKPAPRVASDTARWRTIESPSLALRRIGDGISLGS